MNNEGKAFKPATAMTFETVSADCLRLAKYCQETPGNLSIDLSEVSQCDSAGLALLIEAKRLARESNKHCNIEKMPVSIQALAEFCAVDALLTDREKNEIGHA